MLIRLKDTRATAIQDARVSWGFRSLPQIAHTPVFLAALLLASAAGAQAPAPPRPLSADDASAIAAALAEAPAQGLPSADVGAAVTALATGDPAVRPLAEATLAAAAVTLAAEEHGLIADPRSVDKDFHLRADYDAAADFQAARAGGRIPAWAAALAPAEPLYGELVKARALYARIVAAGGWAQIPAGPSLKAGASDPRAPLLRARLAAEGYDIPPPPAPPPPQPPAAANAVQPSNAGRAPETTASPAPDPNRYDAGLASALAAFQTRHELPATGVLDEATTAALDAPAQARLGQIDANLERERWLPREAPQDRVEVDIAGPTATLFRGGVPTLGMRAIVGKPSTHTPSFISEINAIVFNPPWVVPTSIAAKELYPKERRSPGYFAREGIEVVNGQLVQRPGPKAALGYLKFDMPDPYGVYLHDTPARTLFARNGRWLSHGCMRLQAPRELAAALLAPQGWNPAAIDAAIAAKTTRRVELRAHMPVFVVYRTVVADADGRAVFRADPYGWDAELEAALAAR